MATSQAIPRTAGNHQKLEEVRKESSLEPSEEGGPSRYFDFRFSALRTER